jgi:hypothetical protein
MRYRIDRLSVHLIKGVFALTLLFLFGVARVWAQTGGSGTSSGGSGTSSGGSSSSGGGAGFRNPLSTPTLPEFLNKILDVVITIGFPIIVLAVVYTGFLFVKAQGNKEELGTAKKAFMWTVIGALIILGAQALSFAIEGTVDQLRGSEGQLLVQSLKE